MNKAELIARIAEKAGLTKTQAEDAFSALFETISEALVKQDKIMIPGFGGFSSKKRLARKGRNPSTGEEMLIKESMVANFKPASQLKELLNTDQGE